MCRGVGISVMGLQIYMEQQEYVSRMKDMGGVYKVEQGVLSRFRV